MRKLMKILVVLAVLVAAGIWITRPQSVDAATLAEIDADPARGKVAFAAMGCASCHAAPDSDDRLTLAGGHAFTTDFGTFYASNISPDPTHGIGEWSDADIASAVKYGRSSQGQHLYPALPYTSYIKADLQDIADMIAYLRTLPADATPNRPHDVGFPFNIRLSLGGWKFLYLNDDWVVAGDLPPEQTRGRVLVEALGHCAECHTPRDALGGLQTDQWLAGAPSPDGEGRIPDLRPTTLGWSATDIAYYLETGLTPDFDSAGGEMADVIKNTSQLPPEDRDAIAAYLLALP